MDAPQKSVARRRRSFLSYFASVSLAVSFAAFATPAFGQAWANSNVVKLIFPSSGNDPAKTMTILAPTITGSSFSWTLPNGNAIGLLLNSGTGTLSWSAGSGNTFLTTTAGGSLAWSGLNISSNLTGNGISSPLDISGTYAGSGSINTVGTISSGTWHGDV